VPGSVQRLSLCHKVSAFGRPCCFEFAHRIPARQL